MQTFGLSFAAAQALGTAVWKVQLLHDADIDAHVGAGKSWHVSVNSLYVFISTEYSIVVAFTHMQLSPPTSRRAPRRKCEGMPNAATRYAYGGACG